jgi:hypothetical protein
VQKKIQGFILVRAEHPYIQFELFVFLHLLAVGVTNGRESERAPKSLVAKCSCEYVSVSCILPLGGPPLRFYRPREGVRYTREREIRSRKRRVPGIPLLHSLHVCLCFTGCLPRDMSKMVSFR